MELIIYFLIIVIFALALIMAFGRKIENSFLKEFYGENQFENRSIDEVFIYDKDVYPIRNIHNNKVFSVEVFAWYRDKAVIAYYDYSISKWCVDNEAQIYIQIFEELKWIYPPQKLRK